MSSRSLNKVMLIGNLTRDVEVRYTPSGTAVATFGLATNRTWSSGDGSDRQEEVQFHRIVAWSKLADICGQLLFKGRKVYIEGRLQTRKFTGQDGQQREITEIVAETMMILDTRTRDGGMAPAGEQEVDVPEVVTTEESVEEKPKKKASKKTEPEPEPMDDSVNVEDIPF
jgi:single-strand DNA-binding protein